MHGIFRSTGKKMRYLLSQQIQRKQNENVKRRVKELGLLKSFELGTIMGNHRMNNDSQQHKLNIKQLKPDKK